MRKTLANFMADKADPPAKPDRPEREWVTITVKVHRDDHRTLTMTALGERKTLQDLGCEGLSLALEARGLPPLRQSYKDA